jgi:hypothetical protein
MFPTGAILLESAWAAPPEFKITLEPKTVDGITAWSVLKDQMSGAVTHEGYSHHGFKLQSITARYRIADLADESKDLFKLGFSLGAGANIELRKVDQAGLDAVVEIDTYWLDPEYALLAGQAGDAQEKDRFIVPPAEAYETAVPRVVLLHQ